MRIWSTFPLPTDPFVAKPRGDPPWTVGIDLRERIGSALPIFRGDLDYENAGRREWANRASTRVSTAGLLFRDPVGRSSCEAPSSAQAGAEGMAFGTTAG
jgi:hypothetical protein